VTSHTVHRPANHATLLDSLRVALVPWAVSRIIVIGALMASRWLANSGRVASGTAIDRVHQGLVGWDTGWYLSIASHGYVTAGRESARFFPLWPEILRGIHGVGLPLTASAIIITSALWLGVLVLVDRLARIMGASATTRTTSLWLMSLTPGALASVMGYAEPLLVLLVTGTLIMLRSRTSGAGLGSTRWIFVGLLAAGASLSRPVGVLLVIPICVEAWQRRGSDLLARVLAILSPVVALAGFLSWCKHAFGDLLLPIHVQTEAAHHGGFANPVTSLITSFTQATSGHASVAFHLVWVGIALVLCVIGFRRSALSLALFSASVVLAALSGHNLDSFERYLFATPPLFIVAAGLLAAKWARVMVLVVLAVGLFGFGILAFTDQMVP